ncbi:hypothetical protein SAMN05518865_113109 [Duganella sp. CF458]|uniref:hypothetical protein n=1 Tax=Duganella sp. CF458 TaxID=1884368 RepID=UPI0008EA3ED7|nr:hypothetical protein [Duganella sp. CF458]SFG52376.1 hypothetical protein SAMN05518865_113109 [Duganella sp. CF458]
MNFPLLLALAAGLFVPAAGAETLDEYRQLPECRLSADGKHLLQQPCRTARTRKNRPRRPVPLIITPTPRIAPAPDPALSWAPVLTQRDPHAAPTAIAQLPRAVAPAVPMPVTPLPGPSAPIPVQCDAGGCRDAGGTYYHGTPGQVVSPSGKVCSQSGGWMTCY